MMAHIDRRWRTAIAKETASVPVDLTVASYNILASIHIKPRGYPFCPTGYREMMERHPQLMVELHHHGDADIFCLQEVETSYYQAALQPAMERLGYSGNHFEKALGIREGLATFYKRERFSLVKQEVAHFKDLIAQKLQEETNLDDRLKDAIIKRAEYETPVMLTTFHCRQTGRHLVMANVHLVWQTHLVPDLNTVQAAIAVQKLKELSPPGACQIICGDFNHRPSMPGYQLLQDGCLDNKSHQHLQKFPLEVEGLDESSSKTHFMIDAVPHWFHHDLGSLKSSYAAVRGEEPEFTSYTCDYGPVWLEAYMKHSKVEKEESTQQSSNVTPRHFPAEIMDSALNASLDQPSSVRTLDYIWYSSDTLCCLGVQEVVDQELIKPFWACPNQVFPSDHLLMKASFSFK
ncbi:uncharacterized protein [Diadema antillarum]|uniref:uncharacterized protein n=1 Tax=Diadema antillarum TaxID=105358 RepID=UPI003A88B98A